MKRYPVFWSGLIFVIAHLCSLSIADGNEIWEPPEEVKLCKHGQNVRAEDGFTCVSKNHCINKTHVCNGVKDCPDNSDEALCECTSDEACLPHNKHCHIDREKAISRCSKCPQGKQFGVEQCEDIDECKATDQHDPCKGIGSCLNFDGGYTCVQCPKGYIPHMHSQRYYKALEENTGSPQIEQAMRQVLLCNDQNECALDNPCDPGYCINTVGSFRCECPPNHAPDILGDSETRRARRSLYSDNVCRAIGKVPEIAIANNRTISLYDLRTKNLIKTIE